MHMPSPAGSVALDEGISGGTVSATQWRLAQVGIVGAPNAGKSSLTNALAGRKVAAVSARTNTTSAARLATFTDGSAAQVRSYHFLNKTS